MNENARKRARTEADENSSQKNNDQSEQNNTSLDHPSNNNNNNNTSMNSSNDGNAGKNAGTNNNSQSNSNTNNASRSKRVYVANVPFDVKWSELKDLFREKVGNVTYCTIFENEDGKSRGCGLVEFQDVASARKAIEIMHRSEFKNRELVVKEDLDVERDRFGRIVTNHGGGAGGGAGGGGGGGGGGGNRMRDDSQRRDGSNNDRGGRERNRQMQQQQQQQQQQHQQQQNDSYGYDHSVMNNAFGPPQHQNTYGLSQQFLDSLGIGLPLNNRIFVANLEYKVDQNKLEEIFKLAGKVSKVKLSYDNQGQSRGYGTVEFEHPVEAVQAISMLHNQKLYGRTMSVRMDKYETEDDADTLPTKLPAGLESIGKGLGVGGQPLNIAKSIMNAALIAPPHLTPAGQPIPQMHQAVGQPAAMQQAVIAAQMQQLQAQQQQQQQHAAAVPQPLQQGMPPTMQHQLQQSLPQPMQQQYQMHQLAAAAASQQAPQQALQQGIPPTMPGVAPGYPTMQQLQAANQAVAGGVRAPTTSVYQSAQQPQQPSQAGAGQGPAPITQPATSAPAANLSVYSTFERQFREASAPQGFTRN